MRNNLKLEGNLWKQYLGKIPVSSLWKIARRGEGGSAKYPGNFVPEIPEAMILRYTREGETVADMFAGSETTKQVAFRLNREYIGCDLRPNSPDTDRADARWWKPNRRARLTFLHPPYADAIDYNEALEPKDGDLSLPWSEFLDEFKLVVQNAIRVTEPGGVIVLVMGDLYRKGEHLPLAWRCIDLFLQRSLILKGVIVKDFGTETKNSGKNRNLWVWRALQHGFWLLDHEYVAVFQVPETGRRKKTGPLSFD